MTLYSVIVDVAVLVATCVLAYMKVLPAEAAVGILSAVVAARAALMRPPGGGDGNSGGGSGAGAAMAGSGAVAVLAGIGSVLSSQRHHA